MYKWMWGAVVTALVLTSGCAYDSTVGSGGTQAGQFFGDFGRTGYGGNYLIGNGSRLWKISILGDNNIVTIEDGVTLNKIEIWGSNNKFSLPWYLDPRITQVGKNFFERRPPPSNNMNVPAEQMPMTSTTITPYENSAAPYSPPPASTQPAPRSQAGDSNTTLEPLQPVGGG